MCLIAIVAHETKSIARRYKCTNMSTVLLCVAIIIIVALYVKWKNYVNKFSKLPSPKGHPIIGHYLHAQQREKGFEYGMQYVKECGKTFKLFLGPIPVIITSDSKLLELILTSNTLTEKSREYRFFKRWWGDGLLTSSGYKWKSHRKILTPAFHYNILEDFVDVFEENGKKLIENLRTHVDSDSVNIMAILSLYTLDVICETAMGTTVNAQTSPNNKYFRSVKELCEIGVVRSREILNRFDFFYKFTSTYKREIELVTYVKEFSTRMIRNRRKVLEKNGFQENVADEFGKKRKTTFMDILLMSKIDGDRLSDEDVREEVDTFLFEGHDTTAAGLSFVSYNLAMHPEIQAKAYEEIASIFGSDKDRAATIEDLQNMKYLDKIIKESLRLYPSVPTHARLVLEDIDYDGYTIPKGITLVISQYVLHRDEKVFPDPEKFDPDRFDLDKQLGRGNFAYIPFSAGFRNCIGQKFAMLEMKSAISKILRQFELVPAKPDFTPKLLASVTLISLNGVHVGLKKRL